MKVQVDYSIHFMKMEEKRWGKYIFFLIYTLSFMR